MEVMEDELIAKTPEVGAPNAGAVPKVSEGVVVMVVAGVAP